VSTLLVGAYAWLVAVSLGAILLDVTYARHVTDPANEVADLLLLIVGLAFLTGVAAVTAAWRSPAARNLLLASLALVIGEFLVPALAGSLIRDAQATMPGLGPVLRIGGSAAVSVTAFVAFALVWRDRPRAEVTTERR
jgi:hypothetical protein